MTYVVDWGLEGNEVRVATGEELDAALDQAEAYATEHGPVAVDVFPDDGQDGSEPDYVPYGMVIGVGHAERSFAVYVGEPAGGVAVDPALPAWGESVTFDYGGEPTPYAPEQLRLTPGQAREVAAEYVRTGGRPVEVAWETGEQAG